MFHVDTLLWYGYTYTYSQKKITCTCKRVEPGFTPTPTVKCRSQYIKNLFVKNRSVLTSSGIRNGVKSKETTLIQIRNLHNQNRHDLSQQIHDCESNSQCKNYNPDVQSHCTEHVSSVGNVLSQCNIVKHSMVSVHVYSSNPMFFICLQFKEVHHVDIMLQ